MGRPGIMVYFDIIEPLAVLSNEDRGVLFTAMLDYGKTGKIPAFEGMLALAWGFVKPRIDKDAQSYADSVRQRKYAAFCKKRRKEKRPKLSIEEWEQMEEAVEELEEEWEEERAVAPVTSRNPSAATTSPTKTETNTTISTAAAAATNTPPSADPPEGDDAEEVDTTATTAEYKKLKYWGGKLGKKALILSEEQFDYLLDTLGLEMFDYYLDKLSSFIVEKDAKVKDHFGTILRWWKEDSRCVTVEN
ncbi:MAG: hypothetical protein E7437_08180 [Ruminococcaceae bacterium]|nr:hypothetical protein [Oscillospiraceae bacterium]